MVEEKTTTALVKITTMEKIESLKVHPREPFNDVIERLYEFWKNPEKKEE